MSNTYACRRDRIKRYSMWESVREGEISDTPPHSVTNQGKAAETATYSNPSSRSIVHSQKWRMMKRIEVYTPIINTALPYGRVGKQCRLWNRIGVSDHFRSEASILVCFHHRPADKTIETTFESIPHTMTLRIVRHNFEPIKKSNASKVSWGKNGIKSLRDENTVKNGC